MTARQNGETCTGRYCQINNPVSQVATGMDREQVQRVIRLVDLNEYKRRQAPIGVRITQRGFGRDRRYPITSGWTIGD